jgi:hypothetical protein
VGSDAVQQTFAGLGRRNATRCSGKQTQAQALLKRADRIAQRRLGDTKLRRRLGEALLAGDGDKGKVVVHVLSAFHKPAF